MRKHSLLAAGIVLLIGASTPTTHGQSATSRVERGQLARGDDTLDSGEFVDSYTFQGTPNQRVTIDLSASDFDGYLVLIPPKGEQLENDDADDEPDHSVIEADLEQRGTYRVLVTSYEKGETGPYALRISFGEGAGGASPRRRDSVSMAYGQTRNDRLEKADPLDEDKYVHERYRSDVKSSSERDNFVRTSGPQTGYQHLVVDRGSIAPFDVLFRR